MIGKRRCFLIVIDFAEAYNAPLMHIIFQKGLASAKKNFGPGLLLQGFALALVLLYYFNGPVHQSLRDISEIKEKAGALFPILSTSLFGGFLPFIFLLIRKEIPKGRRIPHLFFMMGFWAVLGLTIDALYKGQALLFGDQTDAATIIKKVLVDQFVFSVLWSSPFSALAMKWKQCGFSFRATKALLHGKTFAIEVLSILVSLWAVWIPTVAIVYSLPLALQFPLFSMVLCFWSLLLTTLSEEKTNESNRK